MNDPNPAVPEPARRQDVAQEIALHSLETALERVRGEALVYRSERDEALGRAGRAEQEKARALARLGESRAEVKRLRGQIRAWRSTRVYRTGASLRRARRWLVRHVPSRGVRPPRVDRSPTEKPSGTVGTGEPLVTALATALGHDEEEQQERSRAAGARAARLRSALPLEVSGLRVAAVVDEFTRRCLARECSVVDLHAERWADQLHDDAVDLVFVESAWRGREDSWHDMIPGRPSQLLALLETCRARGVPTVFWNKDDPVHFDTFLDVAAEFDHVFTTDLDRVPDYRTALGHDRVHVLPFAAQTSLHSPVERSVERRNAVVFAGGSYAELPQRQRDLVALVDGASSVLPVEIFDRLLGTTFEAHQFPERFRRHVVGTLHPSRIDHAYKGYRYALNLNSVKESGTTFSRRALELVASGTPVVSNYARGLKVLLGDLIVLTDHAEGARRALLELESDELRYSRTRAAGIRKVHREHTYRERLRQVVAAVTATPYELETLHVVVLARVATQAELERVRRLVESQTGVTVAVAVAPVRPTLELALAPDETLVPDLEAPASELVTRGIGVAVLDPAHWYGPAYLLDLVLAARYAGADVIGRAGTAVGRHGRVEAPRPGLAYRPCHGLTSDRSLVLTPALKDVTVEQLLDGGPAALDHLVQFSLDRFDFCADGAACPPEELAVLDSTFDGDDGLSITEVVRLAATRDEQRGLRPVVSAGAMQRISSPDVSVCVVRGGHRVDARLPDGRSRNLWFGERLPVADAEVTHGVRFSLESRGPLSLQPVVRFLDEHGAVVRAMTHRANTAVLVPVPDGATSYELGLRASGSGRATVQAFNVGPRQTVRVHPAGRSRTLLVTDNYPSYADLYRNGFVHARVRAYRRHGLDVDVYRFFPGAPATYGEFEGIEVVGGGADELRRVLEVGSYDTILVHFMSDRVWNVLKDFSSDRRIIVWLHGAEIQPWWRRTFNYERPDELARAQVESDARLAFWRGLVDELPPLTTLVFVSGYFAREVISDLDRPLPRSQVSIVHNPVDTDIFRYVPKPVEQRTRILSIRPYATRKYANDLSVAAVLELSKEPWFDELEFLFVGDGTLFDEVLEPVRDLPNVTVQQGFLTQPEIAELHREYGVFLVPTRMDAQGVSKDEAMASGLVPVTNDVAAIPEFVSEAEGYLAAPDDATGMADAIRDLYHHPEVFAAKSAAAAARVRAQTAADVVVPAEVALIRGERPAPAPDEDEPSA